MNALMTIQVRVLSASALAQLRAVEAQSRKTAAGVGSVGRQAQWGLPYLSKWGNQVQWAGRQLMYNFTLPIALATAAGTKFALDNEKAMVRVVKVYGDSSKVFNRLAKTEIPALADAFEALSSRFGVTQSQVIQIAGDWAAAGASGIALAKSVKLTLETMVLGELEAVDATRQLIAIQAQYGFGVTDLTKTIDILNMVENETGSTMKDLMDGMSRAAGVARVAGVDVEHLAAMMAALTPASGSAATAGNALKTIISRILSPTKEAVELMRAMGVEVDATAWQSQNATDRIEALAEEFDNLSSAQKTHMATVLGSRWQLNRLVILMQAVRNENSYYTKALESTADRQAIFNQRQQELQKVLESNPQRIQQAWVILQNAMARVIVPLLPYIVYIISEIARLADAFANLDGEWQKLILAGLAFLAIIGPVARYVGALANLFGLLSGAIHFFGAGLGLMAKQVTLANGTVVMARKGLLQFFGTMLLLPFKPFIAALGLMQSAFMLFAGLIGPALTLMVVNPFKALAGPITAAWSMLLVRLKIIWLAWAASMQTFWKVFSVRMQVVWTAMMSGLRMITAAGAAAVNLVWTSATSGFYLIGMATRQALWTLWLGLYAGLQRITVAGGLALNALWTLVNRALVTTAAAMSLSVRKIWIGMLAMGRGVMTGLSAMAFGIVSGIRGVFAAGIAGLLRLGPLLLRAITGPIGLAITAAITLILMFRDEIVRAWNNIADFLSNTTAFEGVGRFFHDLGQTILDAFWALPEGVRSAMLAVLTVVRDAALQIYEWMSYLNPFARHSPSLVEQVKAGMDEIERQYGRSGNATGKFKDAQKNLEAAIQAQERVVLRWKRALDIANYALDLQQDKLDGLQDKLDAVTAVYQGHADAIQNFASAPIKGMQAMSDKIFENEMAQKKLRLEMLKFEQANGSIDDMRSRLDALYGDIERLRGRANELRMAGAGSDILGPINQQIAAMEAQAAAIQNTVKNNPIDKLQEQMDQLQMQGEILQLQNDIKYDPMIRSIEQLANAQKELSYNQIINGINKHKAAMEALEPRMNRLTKAVEAQQRVVDAYTAERDRIQRIYDREQFQLDMLKNRYDDLTGAMDGASSAAKKLKSSLPTAVDTFNMGKGGNWPDPGKQLKIGREGGFGDQSELIRQFTEDTLADMNSIFGGFDMFAPLKRWWSRAWAWIKSNIGPVVTAVGDGIRQAFGSVPNPFENAGFVQGFNNVRDTVIDVFATIGRWAGRLWDLFAPDIKRIVNAFINFGKKLWNEVGPEVEKFRELFVPLTKAIRNIWTLIRPFVGFLAIVFVGAFKVAAAVLSRVLETILEGVIGVVKGVIRFLRGLLEFFVGVFTLDFRMALQGLWDMFVGFFKTLGNILWTGVKLVWDIFSGLVMGVVEFFQWLWDVLVGHSIIPDLVERIVDIFASLWGKIKSAWKGLRNAGEWLWNKVFKPVWEVVKATWTYTRNELREWWARIKAVWIILRMLGKWFWENVLKPVAQRVQDVWIVVKGRLSDWWEGIKNTWSNLKKLGSWVWDNVMKPVIDKIKEGWNAIKDWLSNNKDMLTAPVKGIVNVIIRAVNAIISGLNKVADILPGVDWNIGSIDLLAAGGPIRSRRGNRGFKTTGARAIVGEGKANWPEFVIPTDPTYRNRAKGLLMMAASKIGLGRGVDTGGVRGDSRADIAKLAKQNPAAVAGAIPQFGIGGWLSDRWDDMKGIGSKLADLPRYAASKVMDPVFNWVRDKISDAWIPARVPPLYAMEKLQNWVKGVDSVVNEERLEAAGGPRIRRALKWARSQQGKPYIWGGVGPGGYDCSGFMSAITNVILGKNPHSRVGATATFPWAGFKYGAVPNGFTIGSSKSYAGGIGHMAGTLGGVNVESAGGVGVRIGPAARGYMDPGFTTRAYLALQNGGIVRRTPLGTLARIGEGRHDEAVTPLPKNWRSTLMGAAGEDGTTNVYINGNLEFPNITDGDDAETFIENIKILAKD